MKKIIALAAAVLAAGCVEAGTLPDGADLSFEARQDGMGTYLPQPQLQAQGGDGQVVVTARLSAPDPCQTLEARLRPTGAVTIPEVTLDVTVRPRTGACAAVIGTFAYTARVTGLEPGRYTLRVRHDYPGTGWPGGIVLEETMDVR